MASNGEHRNIPTRATQVANEALHVNIPNATHPVLSYPGLPYYPYFPYFRPSDQYDRPGPPGSTTRFYPIPDGSLESPTIAAPLPQVLPPSALMMANDAPDTAREEPSFGDLPEMLVTHAQSLFEELDAPTVPKQSSLLVDSEQCMGGMHEELNEATMPIRNHTRTPADGIGKVATGQKRVLSELDPNTSLAAASDLPAKRRKPHASSFSYADLDALIVFVDIRKPVEDDEWQSVGEAFNEWAAERGRYTRDWQKLRGKWRDMVAVTGVSDERQEMKKKIERARRIEEEMRRQALVESEVRDEKPSAEDGTGKEDVRPTGEADAQQKEVLAESARVEDVPAGTKDDQYGSDEEVSDLPRQKENMQFVLSAVGTLLMLEDRHWSDVKQLRKEVEDLQTKMHQKNRQILELRLEVDTQKGKYNGLDYEIRNMMKKWLDMETEVKELRGKMRTME